MKVLVVLCSILAVAISEPPVRHGPQYFGPPPPPPPTSSPVSSVKYGVPSQRYVTGPSPTQSAILGRTPFIASNNAIEPAKSNYEPITLSDLIGNNHGSQPTPVYGIPFNSGLTTQSFVVPSQINFGVPSQAYGSPSPTLRNKGGKSNRQPSPTSNSLNSGRRPSTQYGVPHASVAPAVISQPSIEYAPQHFNSAPIISTSAYLPQTPQTITIPKSTPAIISSDEYSPYFPNIETESIASSGYSGKSNANYDSKSLPANYEFEYAITDPKSGNDFGHRESRQEHSTQGRYYVQLPDGRRQIVEYEADHNGYRSKITYEGEANFNTNAGNGKNNAASSQESKPIHETLLDNINNGYRY
ncbi:pro-resilin-like [Chrysoperla carnea]|uniref:pro-resilin-like n=1 Tax=Chrysoperla carnea TaxID=189513 RepID=UPI001D08486B|nr:pro-resilin-like [Chrysoperla carnea]